MDRDREMDRDQEAELDQLMERVSTSVRESLDAAVDVKQRLRDLLREAGVAPGEGRCCRASDSVGVRP